MDCRCNVVFPYIRAVAIFLCLHGISVTGTSNEIEEVVWIQVGEIRGYLPVTGFSWSLQARSLLECTRLCSTNVEVKSLFYVGISGLCQCHKETYSNIYTLSVQETALYLRKRTRLPCEASNEYVNITSPVAMTFRIYGLDVDHDAAVTNCSKDGAELVVIKTAEKQEFLLDLLISCKEFAGHDYWIDGSNSLAPVCNASDAWKHSDSSKVNMTEGLFWRPGTPDYPCEQNCVRMKEEAGFLWDDYNCNQPFGYICEK